MPKPPGLPPNGSLIRELRRKAEIGPSDFAKRIGITYGHLANIENGHAKASAGVLTRIATALGRRTEELIAFPQAPRPEPIPRPPGEPKPPEPDRPPNKPGVAVA